MPSLFVIQGNDRGTRFELETDVVELGRDAANTLQIHDQEVSRHHAAIRRQGEAFVLADLNSSNGTFVNGERVNERPLASGDQIELGSTLMLFTRPIDDADDLADNIDIIAQDEPGDNSRIVHSVSQAEGSRIFKVGGQPTDSPWLARRSNLQVMYRTALAVSHTLDIDQLLGRIMQLIFEWVEADRGCIMLVRPDSKKLEPKVRLNRKGLRAEEKLTITQTILNYVLEHNEGVLTSNAREDNRWNPAASILQMGIREAICVPMQGRYGVVGVIYIDTSTSPQRMIQTGGTANKFTEEHLKLMIAIAHQAALAVEDTRYYSAMVHAERLAAVGQTIATLSHHIKNILQGIRGGSFLIEDGLTRHDEGQVAKGWGIVEKAQQKISNVVMDMLTFSKEREPDLAPADMNQVVGDVVELMQTVARERNIQLDWQPAADMPTLTFDAEGIHRAVLNIVSNALDACDKTPDGRVRVSTEYREADAMVSVTVHDNGCGIPPEDLDQIFTLFMSRKRSRGTGLGLPVSQKIVQEHGGRIQVQSEPGRGTQFTLELPAIVPESAKQTAAGAMGV